MIYWDVSKHRDLKMCNQLFVVWKPGEIEPCGPYIYAENVEAYLASTQDPLSVIKVKRTKDACHELISMANRILKELGE